MMSKQISRLLTLSSMAAALFALVGCDLHDPKPFDAMSMQRMYRERATEQAEEGAVAARALPEHAEQKRREQGRVHEAEASCHR